ncbi:hypothetical protein PVAND_014789 [Polypedilum vanderplanki]|uniref:Uncharacterized protein n=1 Tax=Polypedilum vanderplanki TaxID=319348 RepID=A0A9J6BB80_POLVA|nr:hypothetical protein PVAND_014789 [Polypedilum vanderplanki]
MFQVDKFLCCVNLEKGCKIIGWFNYVYYLLLLWISLFFLFYEVFALFFGIGKLKFFIVCIINIAYSAASKFIYKKFLDELGNLDKTVVIWPIFHLFFSIITTFLYTTIVLFVLGATSDVVYVLVISVFEIINIYCLIMLWSLYKKFQNGMPLTNEV